MQRGLSGGDGGSESGRERHLLEAAGPWIGAPFRSSKAAMVRIQSPCAKWERGKAAIGNRSVSLKCFLPGIFLGGGVGGGGFSLQPF